METILTIIFGLLMLAAIVVIFAWFIIEWGRKQMKWEEEYEKLYSSIQRDIWNHEPYDEVKTSILFLETLAWKNPEKTRVLKEAFWKEYREENDKFVKSKLLKHIEKRKTVKV